MGEAEAIAATDRPATVASLTGDLRRLGVSSEHPVIVHSSLSALGWVAGGAQAVVEALFAAVGRGGTLVMPTQSGQLSDPAEWSNPPVPDDWVELVRNEMPAYDPHLTPVTKMGRTVECFLRHPETVRSDHPTESFAANGPLAAAIVEAHQLSPSFGEGSPLSRLYDLDARVLLVGVGHANNTSLHLAEHRASWAGKTTAMRGAPVQRGGRRVWASYEDLPADDEDFARLGEAFAATGVEKVGAVGAGTARWCRQRDVVDFGAEWISTNRS